MVENDPPSSFRKVIELWETREALAAMLPGVSSSQVSKWWQRDKIPAEYWGSLLETECARAGGVTSDLLTALAAKEVLEVRA